LVGERYELRVNHDAQLPLVQADEPSLQQVIINLVLNARDSMPDGGTIRLETSALTLDADAARDHLNARCGQFVCVTIADNGCGMTPEVAGRIFEPFFTTKEIGKGTGLGLSVVHGIVQQHEGWIQLATQPGKGSSFKVVLPACEIQTKEIPAVELVTSPAATCGAGEAVLLVEDEPSVREMARLTLEQGGYRVFEAADGPEALVVWEKSPVTIDLLVTDMAMPKGLTGAALARTLVAKAPRLRAIFTSGYTSEVLENNSMIPEGRFLPKPYDPLTLLRTVKLCLDDGNPISST
jgi:CheY-like chemotaxis protein